MTQNPMTWSVVATVAEPIEILVAFAAHHLALGALEVFLFLDDARPGDVAVLTSLPGVVATPCDGAYWQAQGVAKRPDNLTRVQRVNAGNAYVRTQAQWLFHIDADEFLHAAEPVGEVLARVPAEFDFLRVQNVERAYRPTELASVYTTLFRRPFQGRPWQEKALFGEFADYTRNGFCAYAVGKGASRTGVDLQPTLHNARYTQGIRKGLVPEEHLSAELTLCHYDGVTPLSWCAKLMRYHEIGMYRADQGDAPRQRPRSRQQEYVLKHQADRGAVLALHDLLKVVTPEKEEDLWAHGLLLEVPVDPVDAVRRICPWLQFDYKVSSIDAALFTRASAAQQRALIALSSEG